MHRVGLFLIQRTAREKFSSQVREPYRLTAAKSIPYTTVSCPLPEASHGLTLSRVTLSLWSLPP